MTRNTADQHVGGRRRRLRTAFAVAALVSCLAGASTVAARLVADRPAPPAAASFGSRSTPGAADKSPNAATAPPSSAESVEQTAKKRPGNDRPGNDHSPGPSRSATPQNSVPRTIEIPAIGVDTDFVPLDLGVNGELETPSDPEQAGWFTGAYTPGGPGVAVVAAHVTWNGAEAAFFRLGSLERGDRVRVHREDGSTAVFSVRRLDTFAKDDFPTEDVYRHSDRAELVLITCGGRFDADRRSYDSNVIAWADLLEVRGY